ncbi:MAG TPA: carboxypeptidase regulatory-like domain-containing protein [Thermoplasmata archaeon]|nr:carboxypeptidase regulatory-like domain-containing protein [Thermoplasmata archaeon]
MRHAWAIAAVLILGTSALFALPSSVRDRHVPPVAWGATTAVVAPAQSYTVTGNLTDNLTGLPIAGALVVASSGPYTTSTANGSFALVLAGGVETLSVTHVGFHGRSVTWILRSTFFLPLRMTPFRWSVTGTVVDAVTATPIIGARVVAEPSGVNATTVAGGSYKLSLENGSYTITASAPGFQSTTATVNISGVGTSKFILLPPANGAGSDGPSIAVIAVIGSVIAAAVVAFAYVVVRRWRPRTRALRDAQLAGIPAERDPNAPVRSRSMERSRDRRRRG